MIKSLCLQVALILIGLSVMAQANNWNGTTNTDWNTATNWSLNVVPTSAHDVVIPNSNGANANPIISISNAQCKSLTLSTGNRANSVTVNAGATLVVNGNITIEAASGNITKAFIVNGTVLAVSLIMTDPGTDNRLNELSIGASGNIGLTADLTMPGNATRNKVTFTGAGTLSVQGAMTGGGLTASTGTVIFSGSSPQTIPAYSYYNLTCSGNNVKSAAASFSVAGTLNIASGIELSMGNFDLTGANLLTSGNGALTTSSSSATPLPSGRTWSVVVQFTLPGNQTIPGGTYNNFLYCSGGGTKSAGGNLALNSGLVVGSGITLDMGSSSVMSGGPTFVSSLGTIKTSVPTATSAVPLPSGVDWGTSGVVEYAAATSQTATSGSYYNLTMSGGGTKTASGVISVDNNFSISSGVTFSTSAANFAVTLGGNFTNAGTFSAGSADIIFSGTKNQSIAGFTTNGRVVMEKTGGIATMAGAMNAAALTLNGVGGTLNMGTGLTHNINTNWVVQAGTMNMNTSTINVTGTVDLPAGGGGAGAPGGDATIDGGGGTVNFNATTIPQTVPAGTYFNLSLAGGNAGNKKSLAGGVEVSNNLTVGSGAYLELGDNNIAIGSAANSSIAIDGTVDINGVGRLLQTSGGGAESLNINAGGVLRITNANAALPSFDNYVFHSTSTVFYGASTNQSISATPTYGLLSVGNGGTKSHAANLTAHSIIIGTGTTLATLGGATVLTVQGADALGVSWDNSGTYSPAAGSTVTFTSAGNQAIKGTATTTFSKLAVNKTAGILTLQVPAKVAMTLQLQNGKIASGTNTLTLENSNPTQQITGGSSTSYVYSSGAGRLRRNNLTINTVHAFPVGTSNYYMPVTVTPFDATSDFAVNTFQGLTQDGTPSGTSFPNKNPVVDAVWNIDRPIGSGDADITISWDAALEGSSFTTFSGSQIGISHYTLGNWEVATGSGDNTANTATSMFSSFSPFAVGKTGTILPISFGNIKAYEKQRGVQIDWSVIADQNVSDYIVERSADAKKFSKIGTVASRQSQLSNQYDFFDAAPLPGTGYYRIKSVQKDGSTSLSTILRINLNKTNKEVVLYPNPIKGNVLSLLSSDLAKGNYTVRMYNAGGQEIMQLRFDHSGGAINQTIALPRGINPGVYQVQLDKEGNRVMSKKLMVQ